MRVAGVLYVILCLICLFAGGKFLGLFGNKVGVFEIVDAHSATHFGKRLSSHFASGFAAAAQHVEYGGYVLFESVTAFADRCQFFFEHVDEQLFDSAVAETAASIVVFQLLKILIVGGVSFEMLVANESIEIDERAVAFEMSRVAYVEVLWVGVHTFDFLSHFFSGVGEVDAVAERFAHLCLSVGARQAQASGIVG